MERFEPLSRRPRRRRLVVPSSPRYRYHPGNSSLVLAVTLLALALFIPSTSAQSIGSFFTAIYINGNLASVSSSSGQVSCSEMGQSNYCCQSGQTCEWDDAGKVACCPAGGSCSGSPYEGSGGGGNYQAGASSSCDSCQQGGGNVVPIVPVTKATLLTSYNPPPTTWSQPTTVTTWSQPTTTTWGPGTTTITPLSTYNGGGGGGGGGQVVVTTPVPVNSACGNGGLTTIVEGNVGMPSRTVGCYLVINEGSKPVAQEAISKAIWGCVSLVLGLLVRL